jgi:hypothetical protein
MILSVTVAATLASLCPILAQPSGSGSISSGHQIAVTIPEIWGDEMINEDALAAQPVLQRFLSLIARHKAAIVHTLVVPRGIFFGDPRNYRWN